MSRTEAHEGRERQKAGHGAPEFSLPGIPLGELLRLLSPVTCHQPGIEPSLAAERFARAALTTAIEPGDLDAGRLLDVLGPVGLVRAIVDGEDARRGLHLAREHDAEGRASEEEARWSTSDAGTRVRTGRGAGVSAPAGDSFGGGADTSGGRAERGTAESGISDRRIAACLGRWRPRLSLSESARAVERAARIGAQLLTPADDCWPEGLFSLEVGAPIALWVRGDPQRLQRLDRSVALVGARASTDYGEHVAMESAAGLSDRGFMVVSGGAYGIDAAAHRSTLASGGMTVAFLAGGVDRLYPAGNSDLLRRIAAEGVLAAELPPGNAPTRWRFLMRNRLIAAASAATVVVEAGRRSGSLNTAGHAAQLGRPLGAVPGSVLSPASAGCHRLIREYDATCVTTTDEMAELADPLGNGPDPEPTPTGVVRSSAGASDSERSVLAALSPARAASADEIAARAALPFATVAAVLGRLDLVGRARENAGGWTRIEGRSG